MKAEDYIKITTVGDFDQAKYVSVDDAKKAVQMVREESADINSIIKKWTLWCFNYHTPFERVICKIWGGTLAGFGGRYYCEDNHFTKHLIEKWQSFENRGDARMLFFYLELDSGLRKQLVDWVMENYRG